MQVEHSDAPVAKRRKFKRSKKAKAARKGKQINEEEEEEEAEEQVNCVPLLMMLSACWNVIVRLTTPSL
jgi:hypothetical protein